VKCGLSTGIVKLAANHLFPEFKSFVVLAVLAPFFLLEPTVACRCTKNGGVGSLHAWFSIPYSLGSTSLGSPLDR